MAALSARERRTDGAHELSADIDCLYGHIQRLWVRHVREARTGAIAAGRLRHVDRESDHQPDLAALFPIRTGGVGLAVAYVLEKAADARRGLTAVQECANVAAGIG